MKIGQIVSTFYPYKAGMGNTVLMFSKVLKILGHDVKVITPLYKKYDKRIEDYNNISILRIPPFFKIGNAAFIPNIMKKLVNFDLLILHYPFFGGAEFILLKKIFFGKKIKIYLYYHMDAIESGVKGIIFSIYNFLFLPLLLKISNKILVSSFDYIENSKIRNYYFKNKNKFFEIGFAVDTDKFMPVNKDDNKIKKIIFVGALDKAHKFKGLNILLKAISEIKNFEWELYIIGRGNLLSYYINESKILGIENKIKFLDNVSNEELIKYYQSADLLILPSINRSEAFGMVIIEALACGVPVIASDLPGVRKVFINNENGLLSKPNDSDDLKNKIISIFSDINKNKNMRQSARVMALEKYSISVLINKFNKLLK